MHDRMGIVADEATVEISTGGSTLDVGVKVVAEVGRFGGRGSLLGGRKGLTKVRVGLVVLSTGKRWGARAGSRLRRHPWGRKMVRCLRNRRRAGKRGGGGRRGAAGGEMVLALADITLARLLVTQEVQVKKILVGRIPSSYRVVGQKCSKSLVVGVPAREGIVISQMGNINLICNHLIGQVGSKD